MTTKKKEKKKKRQPENKLFAKKTNMTGLRDRRRTNVHSKKRKGGVGRCDYGSYLGPRVDGRGGAGGRQGYHPVVPLVCGKGRRKERLSAVYPPYSAWGRNAGRGPLRVRCISQRGG